MVEELKRAQQKSQRFNGDLNESHKFLNSTSAEIDNLLQQLERERASRIALEEESDVQRKALNKMQNKCSALKEEMDTLKRNLAEAQNVIDETERSKKLNEQMQKQQEELTKIKDPDGEMIMHNILTEMHEEVDTKKRLIVQRLMKLVNTPNRANQEIK